MNLERLAFYIDGFNLYFGLKDKGWRKYYLLNLHELDIKGGMSRIQGCLPYKLLKTPNTLMDPLPFAAGIGVMDKDRFPDPL